MRIIAGKLTKALAALTLAFATAVAPASAQSGGGWPGMEQGSGSQGSYGSQGGYGNQGSYGGQTAQGGYANQTASNGQFTMSEILTEGHNFFGATSGGLAQLVERAFQRFGLPNGYILGEQAGGAFFGGLRYGEGQLYTKNAGNRKVFWQGPSLGFDIGGDGARAMMLVYDLPSVEALFGRFGGVSGSAYLVGGLGMTVLVRDNIVLVPVTTGVGARLGVNIGYLKVTPMPTWNPF